MKILISAAVLAFIIYFIIRITSKNKYISSSHDTNSIQDEWKSTKTTSSRVGFSASSNTNKASDKAYGFTSEINNTRDLYVTKIKKKSYGPVLDPIIEEGNKALSEMGKIYLFTKDDNIKNKIKEIMKITDSIMMEAINDPDDVPQIKKFFRYYLPTTIKLLNSFIHLDSVDIVGENIEKSKKNIYEMLDVAIDAYRKRLDSLFENQALDIETDIDVMNNMLEREGLLEKKDFILKEGINNG